MWGTLALAKWCGPVSHLHHQEKEYKTAVDTLQPSQFTYTVNLGDASAPNTHSYTSVRQTPVRCTGWEVRATAYQGERTFSRSELTAERSRISSALSTRSRSLPPLSGTTQATVHQGFLLHVIWVLNKTYYRPLSSGNSHFPL